MILPEYSGPVLTDNLAGLFFTVFNDERQSSEAVNTNFRLDGFTRLVIEPEYCSRGRRSITCTIRSLTLLDNTIWRTRDYTPRRVTSGGVHLGGLAPWQHSIERTCSNGERRGRWRHCADLTIPGSIFWNSSTEKDKAPLRWPLIEKLFRIWQQRRGVVASVLDCYS